MKKFVFIDIDGTLFDYNNHCVPASAKEALKAAKENGHELFICTGRPKPVVEASYLDLPISGIIYAGGGHIEINGKMIYSSIFPRKELMKTLDDFHQNQIEYSLEGLERNYYTEWMMNLFRDYFCEGKNDSSEMVCKFRDQIVVKHMKEITEEDYHQVSKVDLFAKNDHRIHDYIANLPEILTGFVYSNPKGDIVEAEILVAGTSKASGIDHVLDYFKGSIEDTIALGDSTNDLTMIEHAQIGVAMGNASEELKEKADYITKDVDDDGLYHAFQMLHLI